MATSPPSSSSSSSSSSASASATSSTAARRAGTISLINLVSAANLANSHLKVLSDMLSTQQLTSIACKNAITTADRCRTAACNTTHIPFYGCIAVDGLTRPLAFCCWRAMDVELRVELILNMSHSSLTQLMMARAIVVAKQQRLIRVCYSNLPHHPRVQQPFAMQTAGPNHINNNSGDEFFINRARVRPVSGTIGAGIELIPCGPWITVRVPALAKGVRFADSSMHFLRIQPPTSSSSSSSSSSTSSTTTTLNDNKADCGNDNSNSSSDGDGDNDSDGKCYIIWRITVDGPRYCFHVLPFDWH